MVLCLKPIVSPFPINLDTMYHEDFLPVHQHIKESLNHDGKGVVPLHGVAGSGKTNYIKWLTSQVPNKNSSCAHYHDWVFDQP